MPKVSVIIPVYNAAKYIRRCLDSIINQTLKDIEIIAVDDGSLDGSFRILFEYSQKDSRIKAITQENSKQGAARNRGLEIAKGEYVTFIDSDDWVNKCYLETLYSSAVKYDVNLAAASMTRDKKHKVKCHLGLKNEKTYKGANDIIQAIDNHFETAGKLYKRECIKDLRFREGVLYEDGGFTIRAIDNCNSAVTVPKAVYHYVSNPNSTIKQKLSIKNENDKIETSLDLIDYAKEHNIKTNEWCILKENHLFWGVKHYINRKDFYLCGIKVFSKTEPYNREKVFLVFNTACFGDVVLCNSLCQNIKLAFPYSKVVFISDKKWKDVAECQKNVDEVIVYDKHGKHKGFSGLLRFIKDFKYKKPFASFITYKNERNYIIAKLLKSRFTIMQNNEIKEVYMPFRHADLLQCLTNKKIQYLPIVCNIPDNIKNPLKGGKYIALCCVTKYPPKDIPIETAYELINLINSKTDYKTVLTGNGDYCAEYAKVLENKGADFINLVNKTSILELGALLKESMGVVSCDTGTMHFANAINAPTVAVFYRDDYGSYWKPKPELYKTVVIDNVRSAENIYKGLIDLINKSEVKN